VNEGRLLLDKRAASLIAIRNAQVTVDDLTNFDPFGAGTLLYAATMTTPTNALEDGLNLTVNHQGAVNFNGFSDTINALTISGGTVSTGAGHADQNAALTTHGGLFNVTSC